MRDLLGLLLLVISVIFYNCSEDSENLESYISDLTIHSKDILSKDSTSDVGSEVSSEDIFNDAIGDIYDEVDFGDMILYDIAPSDAKDILELENDTIEVPDTYEDISGDTTSTDIQKIKSSIKIIFPDTYECENPCTFRVETSNDIVKVKYLAEDKWEIGKSENKSNGFEIQYRFNTLGKRVIYAYGYNSKTENAQPVCVDYREYLIKEPMGNKFGVWLWYIEGTGMTHAELAQRLSALGVKRIYIKVADGPADCVFNWPEGCDLDIPKTYKKYGIECWAWSYNYPGDEMNQADALYNAAYVGYDG